MDSSKSCGTGWICSNCGDHVNFNEPHTCPTVGSSSSVWFQEKMDGFKDDKGFAFESALLAFEEELAKRQIQMPPEFAKLIEKHFWELV